MIIYKAGQHLKNKEAAPQILAGRLFIFIIFIFLSCPGLTGASMATSKAMPENTQIARLNRAMTS